jgi:hypothetical protein
MSVRNSWRWWSSLLIGLLPWDIALGSDSLSEFCSQAQQVIVNTKLEARNEIHEDFEAFTLSKPSITPLVTTQYVWPQRSAGDQVMQISCKMKTADHLQSIHGPDTAGVDVGCKGVNQHTLDTVLARMTDRERTEIKRLPGETLLFVDDIVTAQGPLWLEAYPMVREQEGTLIIQSKGMKNDWTDLRYVNAPPQFRGTRYCHLIAPDYLRALLLGQ